MKRDQLVTLSDHVVAFVPFMLARYEAAELTTNLRWAHFLAQTAHESGGFLRVLENLNYSAVGLRATFPKYFKTDTDAALYARQPERIANRVYASRIGNGPEESGDGWKYRGRGLIQVTGRDNYRACSVTVYADDRLLTQPELLERPDGAVASACWYWHSRSLNVPADKDDLEAVTRKINGGLTGLEDRRHWLARAKVVLGLSTASPSGD